MELLGLPLSRLPWTALMLTSICDAFLVQRRCLLLLWLVCARRSSPYNYSCMKLLSLITRLWNLAVSKLSVVVDVYSRENSIFLGCVKFVSILVGMSEMNTSLSHVWHCLYLGAYGCCLYLFQKVYHGAPFCTVANDMPVSTVYFCVK